MLVLAERGIKFPSCYQLPSMEKKLKFPSAVSSHGGPQRLLRSLL